MLLRCVLVAIALAACAGSFTTPSTREIVGSELGFCNPCIQFSEQGLNILLNEIMNAGVIGGCNKLCSGLNSTHAKTACNVVCDVVGFKAFAQVIKTTDLDPIYFCEQLHTCPKGNPQADAKITAVAAAPASGPSGTVFSLQLDFEIVCSHFRTPEAYSLFSLQVNASGVGMYIIGVDGPVTQPVSQSVIQMGWAVGEFAANVTIDTTDVDPDPSSGTAGQIWSPGTYNYTFELCQGECPIACLCLASRRCSPYHSYA